MVLVTHNHYDPLDLATIGKLWRAHQTPIIAPLGNDTIIGQNIGFDLAFLAQQDVKPRGRVYDVFALATIVLPTLPDYRSASRCSVRQAAIAH